MKDKLNIEYVHVDKLNPSLYNPRKHTREALDQLKESIQRFGAVDPLIVNDVPDRSSVVIGGHMRLKAVKELGHTNVPVVYVHIPDIKKEKELNLGV